MGRVCCTRGSNCIKNSGGRTLEKKAIMRIQMERQHHSSRRRKHEGMLTEFILSRIGTSGRILNTAMNLRAAYNKGNLLSG
jgi:hypothetical protein